MIESLRHARGLRPSTALIASGMTLCAVVLMALPASRAVQEEIVKKYTLSHRSFARWAAVQLLPSMYNFGNRLWVGTERTAFDALDWDVQQAVGDRRWIRDRWINHYPIVHVGSPAELLREREGTVYAYCGSRFRGREWLTEVVLEVDPGLGVVYEYSGRTQRDR